MKVKNFLFVPLFFTCSLVFPTSPEEAVRDAIREIPAESIHIDGFIGKMIDQVIKNRIMVQDTGHLVEPFRTRTETRLWQSEFWGKWFLSAAGAYEYTRDPELKKIIDKAVRDLASTQTQDGYIGNYAPGSHLEQWDIWGRKYSLLGLLAYHDLTGDQKILDTAKRLADHLLTEVGPGRANIVKTGNYKGMASSSILEPMVLLYRRTGDKRYLEFARYIVRQWETGDGPQLVSKALSGIDVAKRFPHPERWFAPEQGQKAYEMMSCYDGLLELYRVDGTEEYLRAAEMTVQNIIETEINAAGSGASVECWYGGKEKQTAQALKTMETCVGMTWMKYLFQLYRITGDPVLVDQIEKTAYNALSASMADEGSEFAMYTPLAGTHNLGEGQCGMDLNCCNANAPRAFMLLPRLAFMTDDDGLVVNLFTGGQVSVLLKGTEVKVRQSADYPATGDIEMTVNPESTAEFAVKMRIPLWSKKTSVNVNGEEINGISPGKYVSVTRAWKEGDSIKIKLDMRGRVEYQRDGNHLYASIHRGPVLLARDSRFDLVDEDEIAQPQLEEDGFMQLHPVESGETWMLFTGKFLIGSDLEGGRNYPVELYLCDFASAGNTWDYRSRYRAWLPLPLDPTKP